MGVGFTAPMNMAQERDSLFRGACIGGMGLIITPSSGPPTLASIPHHRMYDDKFIPTHEEFVKRIHKHDAKTIMQIATPVGKLGTKAPPRFTAKITREAPRAHHVRTRRNCRIVHQGCRACAEGRYDGVELHGAHTYLVGAMMSPALTSAPTSTADRSRTACASRGNCGRHPSDCPGFAVGYKMSAHEEIKGGVDIPLGLERQIHAQTRCRIPSCGLHRIHHRGVLKASLGAAALHSRNTLVPGLKA